MNTCGKCEHFVLQPESDMQGVCKKNPPVPMGFYQQGFPPNVNIMTQVSYIPVQVAGIACSYFEKKKGGKR